MIPDLLKNPLKTVATYATPTLQIPGVAPVLSSLGGLSNYVSNYLQGGANARSSTAAPAPPPAPAAPPVVRPPAINLAAINAQARSAAENAVNPYYTKQLNDFLTQQSYAQQQRTKQHETDIKALQENLANTLQGNEITKGRTAEDVAQNQADINQTADQFQTDTGTAADANRIAQARQLAQSGLTGGLGAQQQEATNIQRNTAEKRQEQQFQKQRDQQELFKSRSFEDLARSGELATKAEGQAEQQKLFDLNDYIKTQGMGGFAEQSKRLELEAQRLGAVSQEQQNRSKLAINQYLANIRDPAQAAMAAQIYGNIF